MTHVWFIQSLKAWSEIIVYNTSIMHSTTLNHMSPTVWNEILSMKLVQLSHQFKPQVTGSVGWTLYAWDIHTSVNQCKPHITDGMEWNPIHETCTLQSANASHTPLTVWNESDTTFPGKITPTHLHSLWPRGSDSLLLYMTRDCLAQQEGTRLVSRRTLLPPTLPLISLEKWLFVELTCELSPLAILM